MSDNSSSSEHAAFSRQLPREVSQLHQGLQAAIQARIPIHLGRPADHRSLGKWRRAEGTIASGPATAGTLVRLEVWLQQAASVQTAPNPRETVDAIINDPVLPDRYRMALWAYRNTGRIDLVLEALSVDSRSRQNLARVLRPA